MRKRSALPHHAPISNEKEAKGHTVERGNFVFGRCKSCDWEGKARRSREKAKKDAAEHSDDCKGKGKVKVEETDLRVK